MNGISEHDFYKYSRALNEHIAKYQELEGNNEEELNKEEMSILFFVSELIDQSQGNIQTEDESTKELFRKLFELARGIKQYAHFISHGRNIIKKAQNNSEFDMAVEHFYINQRLYKKYLQDTYDLTTIICSKKNIGSK